MGRKRDPEKQAKWRATWYQNHKEEQKGRVRKRGRDLIDWLKKYKETLVCSRCPENDPVCLDFHHKDPSKKEVILSKIGNTGWSKERAMREIGKCEVLCANCHRKEHRRTLGP